MFARGKAALGAVANGGGLTSDYWADILLSEDQQGGAGVCAPAKSGGRVLYRSGGSRGGYGGDEQCISHRELKNPDQKNRESSAIA